MIEQHHSRHHRRSKTPPPAPARSPSPVIEQHHSRHHRHSKTPPPAPARSPSPAIEQHHSRHHRHSKTPPPAPARSPSPVIDQQQSRNRRSATPPPSSSRVRSLSPVIVKQPEIDNFQSGKQEDVNTTRVNPPPPSSAKRRKRWENEDEFNERQSLAQAAQHTSLEDELRMIAQTSAAQLEPSDHHVNIPQPPQIQTNNTKSKWDDEDDMYVVDFFR